jgi:nucleoside-diphosphate-sugar epimerase
VRALVTGADGFIGSHLVERVARDATEKGYEVLALCMYNSHGSSGWLRSLPGVTPVFGDVRDARFIGELCSDVYTIYHLAALIDVPYSYEAPESYIDTNVKGTLNVLDGAKENDCTVVHVSTSEVYGTPETVPIRETHPLNAQSPYAASKIAADQLALAYHKSFGVDVRIVRPFNTYGPRQSTRGVLPHILTQLLSGAREVPLGNTAPRRDFTYVDDTVKGITAATFVRAGETVHLGTGRSVSIAELFALCCDAVGGSAHDAYMKPDEGRERPRASEVMVLQSDPSKAKALMGWEARVSLEDGIRRTVEWLRSRS